MEFRTVERPTCPICDSAATQALLEAWDDRFGQPDSFPLRFCAACDFAFLGSAIHPECDAPLYAKYYPRPAPELPTPWRAGDAFLMRLARWLDGNLNPAYAIRPGETVLDVGCGTGEIMEIARTRGAKAEGLELNPDAVGVVRSKRFTCYEGSVNTCSEVRVRRYDRIILNQVLEHIIHPVGTLAMCAELLSPGGQIIVAAPHLHGLMRARFGRRWISWHVPYHLNHFSRKSLRLAAEGAGLVVRSFIHKTPGNWLLLQFTTGPAVRGVPNPRFRVDFPIWQRMLTAPLGRTMDFLKRGEGFLALLSAKPPRGS